MTRNEPAQREASPAGEERESTYEAATDVPAADVGPFRVGWEPEVKRVRLDTVIGNLRGDVKYEDFLREPQPE